MSATATVTATATATVVATATASAVAAVVAAADHERSTAAAAAAEEEEEQQQQEEQRLAPEEAEVPQVAAQRSASRLTVEPEGLLATSTSTIDTLKTPEQTADAKAEDAKAAVAAAAAAAAAVAVNEVGRDLGGDRDGDAPLERLPIATDSVVAEGQADEAVACAYSRHAWLLSNPVGVPPDLSATEQGASTVAATLGRADGMPVDPPGLARKP